MKMLLAMAAALALNVGSAGAASASLDPCDDPDSPDCPTSPDDDPWWYEEDGQGPTDGADPVSGPTCQSQVGDESLPPEEQYSGCILPGGPKSPGL